MTLSPRKAFSRSAQLAKTPITAPRSTIKSGSVSMFWVGGGTKSLAQEASDGARSLAVMATDGTLPVSSLAVPFFCYPQIHSVYLKVRPESVSQ